LLSFSVSYSFNYIIVDTDYNNYAVAFFCIKIPVITTVEVAWIYSRQRTLNETYMNMAMNALQAKNLNTQNFVAIKQSGCK
jgi:lipocalin